MGIKKRYQNIVEKFLSGEQGKRFFQIFYSLGAAVIVIGVLAKLMHWPNGLGNTLLYVGFIVEAIVFTISAFDQPIREWRWDWVFPVLETNDTNDRPAFGNGGGGSGSVVIGGGKVGETAMQPGAAASGGKGGTGSGPIIIGGGSFGGFSGGGFGGSSAPQEPKNATEAVGAMTPRQVRQSFGIPNAVEISEEDSNALTASIKKMAAAADQLSKMAEMTNATQQYLDQLTEMSENMQKFSTVTNSLTDVSDVLLNSYKSITDNSDGINQSSRGYVHQMESLNRNIQGLNTIYEIQLKSISSQIDAIERINAGLMRIKDLYEGSIVDSSVFRSETEKMAQQLHALNGVYNRLLNAMTMNMYGAGGNPSFGSHFPNP
ncbi:MAG: gliding motility protein GldL [Candidatus Azobacteroides sp.]|nr:gliding motility protein GldL [Candidatus Azobacteroides sp.]